MSNTIHFRVLTDEKEKKKILEEAKYVLDLGQEAVIEIPLDEKKVVRLRLQEGGKMTIEYVEYPEDTISIPLYPISGELIDLAKEFVKIASRDLEACRQLLDSGYYAQAAFLFEQALEKGIKTAVIALGLAGKSVNEALNFVKELGHSILPKLLHKIAEVIEKCTGKK